MNKTRFIVLVLGILVSLALDLPRANAIVAVFGPSGEVLSYQKAASAIQLRVCRKDSLQSEIERPRGCDLAPGQVPVNLNEQEVRAVMASILLGTDKTLLAPEARQLVERYLTPQPDLGELREYLAALEEQLQRFLRFKAEHPQDHDPKEEARLRSEIVHTQEVLSGVLETARRQVADMLAGLLTDMVGKPVKRSLSASQDGGGVPYNLLRGVLSFEPCHPETTDNAENGYVCRAGDAFWQIELADPAQSASRIFHDLKSDLRVLSPRFRQYDLRMARHRCPEGYHLPWIEENLYQGQIFDLIRDQMPDVVPRITGGKFFVLERSRHASFFYDHGILDLHGGMLSMFTYATGLFCVAGPQDDESNVPPRPGS